MCSSRVTGGRRLGFCIGCRKGFNGRDVTTVTTIRGVRTCVRSGQVLFGGPSPSNCLNASPDTKTVSANGSVACGCGRNSLSCLNHMDCGCTSGCLFRFLFHDSTSAGFTPTGC